jgi:hypothetical protein
MLNSKLTKGRAVLRGFAIFQPRYEYGPVYWERKQFEEDLKLARKRNSQLYQEKQDNIDLDYISRLAFIRAI